MMFRSASILFVAIGIAVFAILAPSAAAADAATEHAHHEAGMKKALTD